MREDVVQMRVQLQHLQVGVRRSTVCLSVSPPIYLSIPLFICLSVYLLI